VRAKTKPREWWRCPCGRTYEVTRPFKMNVPQFQCTHFGVFESDAPENVGGATLVREVVKRGKGK
jgi:hypothetical protein